MLFLDMEILETAETIKLKIELTKESTENAALREENIHLRSKLKMLQQQFD